MDSQGFAAEGMTVHLFNLIPSIRNVVLAEMKTRVSDSWFSEGMKEMEGQE